MKTDERVERLSRRRAPLEMSPEEFREAGHQLVDRIAGFLETLPDRPVTHGESPPVIRELLGDRPLPEKGEDAEKILAEVTDLLIDHSLFNGHPRFWGYITASAAPIGALGDLLAASINQNLGGWLLSPMACEIEAQTVRWIAEFIGYPTDCGGILVSGGNMANFVGFWVGRQKKLPGDVRTDGVGSEHGKPRVYTSKETHTWIQKATNLAGLGTDSIRLIPTDEELRMDMHALRRQIEADRAAGDLPFMVVGTGGSVSTGAIDPLREISDLCREQDLWFHVDGAYGAPVAALPDAHPDIKALDLADSLAIDPHKWFYAPIEAGCTLVRSYDDLRETFAYLPPYYPDRDTSEDAPLMNHELGPQNSKGFRGLKVWLALRQVGREGYVRMISDDIELARIFHELAGAHEELEPFLYGLSVSSFRYVPKDLTPGSEEVDSYLDDLNRAILNRLQKGGEAFISNTVIRGCYVLRMCVVNFRTTLEDIQALPELVVRTGRELDSEMRPASLLRPSSLEE